MYLMIENKGVCPVEGFVVYGLSTARDKEDKIGQFGTGNKHGINTLLRHKIKFYVFRGKQKIEFFTKQKEMDGEPYELVCYKVDNKVYETSSALGHGELDWNNINMAMREFISNAIDRCEDDITITLIPDNQCKGKGGYTIIYIDGTPEVIKYFTDLHVNFLCFDQRKNEKVIAKSDKEPARIYRKGVLVRQVESCTLPALFDYNFGEELPIDESRNLSDHQIVTVVGNAIRNNPVALKTIFDKIDSLDDYWELVHTQKWDLITYKQETRNLWTQIWKEVYSDAIICQQDMMALGMRATKKGFKVIYTKYNNWYNACVDMGIERVNNVLDRINEKGYEYCTEVRVDTINLAHEIWNWFEQLDLTFGKTFPIVKNFRDIMENNAMLLGFYDSATKTIGINVDHSSSKTAMLEEMIHYVSGANDETREFQDFAKKMIIAACE